MPASRYLSTGANMILETKVYRMYTSLLCVRIGSTD